MWQMQTTAVLLNLSDFAAHFSQRLWFWAHFTKNLFQNSWLNVIIALSRNISRLTWRSVAAHRLRSAELQDVIKICRYYAIYNTHFSINQKFKLHVWTQIET